MNPNSTHTRPIVPPDDIEWAFRDGTPSLVVHVPDGEGNYTVYDLTHTAPSSFYERTIVEALLAIAGRKMDDTEPTSTVGASS